MWAENWNNNLNKNINNNDKVYSYWKNSINKQNSNKQNSNKQNTIKISDLTDQYNKYTVEITKYIDGKTFIKEFKVSEQELNTIRNGNYNKKYKIL